ncbi:MAG: ABC transporter permease [Bacteriovoracaceae bacterium]|nr:ABC transporter permease [Bacteriovoracaceae bacterium]
MNDLIIIFTTTLMYSTPLIFVSLGGVMSEKSGIINIGLEGMMTLGAFVASWIALTTGNPWLGFLSGGFAGLLLASLHALASIYWGANQVVSGMAMNFLGGGISIFLCRIFFEGASMTPPLDLALKIPLIFNQYATVYLSFITTLIIWFIFKFTKLGLRIISAGEHPKAAISAGVKVNFYRTFGVLASGFLAGLGGGSLSIVIVSNFRPTLISGQGFIALAALIFGKWNPVGSMLACLFFGFSQALVVYIGGLENVQISSQLLSALPYVLTLVVLVSFMGKSTAPSALGQ